MQKLAMDSYFLGIGEVVLAKAPASIITVLGSCVAITMYSPLQRLGAICHAALPTCPDQQCHSDCCKPGKHVECAVRVMLAQFTRQGVPLHDLQVKIFGGAKMFSKLVHKSSLFAVGSMNDEAARRAISQAGLAIQAIDTGGASRRRLTFHIATGKVMVEKSQNLHQPCSKKAPCDWQTRAWAPSLH